MNSILRLHQFITFPISTIGWLWYVLILTPLFQGNMKGYEQLDKLARESNDEE